MGFWIFVLLFSLPALIERARDPLDGWVPDSAALRDLDCEALSTEGARRLRPGQVAEPSARGDYLERRAVICRERLLPDGVRRGRDEAILSALEQRASEAATLLDELDEGQRARTWHVEVFYPSAPLSSKISFAVKNALLSRGLRVSDRAPTLAAGDVEVIGGVDASRAYPLACARYAAAGSLGADDALLALVLRDPRETLLHAGTCVDGAWRWLR